MSTEDFETRIKTIKSRREQVVNKKAEKVARLKSAQEELKALKEEATEKGYELKEIPELLPQKRKELNGKIALLEAALDEAEEKLAQYD